MGWTTAIAFCGACVMDHTQTIAALQGEIDRQRGKISVLESELAERTRELAELKQRFDIRNLSLERLQSQFTTAAEAVTKLLAEREQIRRSRWAKLGSLMGLIPKLGDDLR